MGRRGRIRRILTSRQSLEFSTFPTAAVKVALARNLFQNRCKSTIGAHRGLNFGSAPCRATPKSSSISTRGCVTSSPPSTNTGCITACSINWGLLEMAKLWRKESIEEMQHADRIADRIIFLDGFPNMQVLDPLRIGLSRHRDKRPRALSGVSDPLPQRGGLRHARPVRRMMKDEEHHIDER